VASEKKFIQKALSDFEVKEFLQRELAQAGVSSIQIQKTPIATRIAIAVRRPGLVVGKKGQTIKDITEMLQRSYGVENPQIEVIEVAQPSLDAKLMAEKVGKQREIKGNAKTAMRFALREIMSAGAIGSEIRAAGKLVGKGGKAKTTTIRAGYLKKSGEESKKVAEGHFTAYLKAGAVGITVKIVRPGTIFADTVDLTKLAVPAISETPVEEKKDEAAKPDKKKRTTTRKRPVKAKEGKTEAKEAKTEGDVVADAKPTVQPVETPSTVVPAATPTPAPQAPAQPTPA